MTAPDDAQPRPGRDLGDLLAEWPFEPGRVNVRRLGPGPDAPIQVRLELGILQLAPHGRPDGQRPGGCESLLESFRGPLAGDPARRLSPEECAALRDEAGQFHQRAVAFLALGDFAGVERDTTRNLDAFDLCRDRAAEPADRTALERLRGSVLILRTRARATAAVREGNPRLAVAAIDRGLEEVRAMLLARGEADRFDAANEVQLLRGMREMLVPKLPTSQRSELEERLRSAIRAENYELAAILRDELRQLP
jgi:hypothetical protein